MRSKVGRRALAVGGQRAAGAESPPIPLSPWHETQRNASPQRHSCETTRLQPSSAVSSERKCTVRPQAMQVTV